MKVKVYVEGGGNGKSLRPKCRQGFSSFFAKANLTGRMPKIIACGGRNSAFDKFRTALKLRNADEFVVLLVDSEDPVADGAGPWLHLMRRDDWEKPDMATDDNAHLMVQCMEAWFLADKDGLAAYFGQGFNRNALPGRQQIEDVAKDDVLDGLKRATRQSKRGEYGKGRHSFDILEQTDPAKVTDASPHARRLVETLRRQSG
ncbi:MAG: DUF4276 family protein [Rhodospirillales bacterium]|nr:DUF4276 family protein [Rhodospirillales bacterium]